MTLLNGLRFSGSAISAALLAACGNPTSGDDGSLAALGAMPSGTMTTTATAAIGPGPVSPVLPPSMSQSAPISAPMDAPSDVPGPGVVVNVPPITSASQSSTPSGMVTSPPPSVSESAEPSGTGGAEPGVGGAPPLGGNAGVGLGGFATGGGNAEPSGGGGSIAGSGGTEPSTPVELTETVIWIAGDSTVATGGNSCPSGWGGQFEALFNDLVSVTNSAVGGRSVRTWLYNVQAVMDEATQECVLDRDGDGNPTLQSRWQAMLDGMAEGHTLLIQFGINDGSATCDRHVGLEAFKESYGMMAAAAKERGTRPIFLTPVSAVACNGDTARGTRGSYVTATIEAGEEFDVPVIDLHQLSVDLYDARGFCPIPGGDVSASTGEDVGAFFCDDHTHFDTAGAIDIAALVAQALRDQNLPLAAYLAP